MTVPRLRMFAGPNGSGKSTGEGLWVAEITDGMDLVTKCSPLPRWFQNAVWNKINPPS